jgi:hypothetical protein
MPATKNQTLGELGEKAVRDNVACPRCARTKQLVKLGPNFPCADLVCKHCGYLAQVKAVHVQNSKCPDQILGDAWGPQHDQIIYGVFHSLFVVGFDPADKLVFIDFVPAHILQTAPDVFVPRNPLSPTAKRAGWTGFYYDMTRVPPVGIARLYP